MIHVRITAELPEDETGPHIVCEERVVLPPWFAPTSREAHDRIITELREQDYTELPRLNGKGLMPFRAWT